jgi:predicted RNA polymerase sigma factor
MARLRVRSAKGQYRVTVSGKFGGRDLRRLEHVCGPALEQPRPPLTVRLAADTTVDDIARAYLDRLMKRGRWCSSPK